VFTHAVWIYNNELFKTDPSNHTTPQHSGDPLPCNALSVEGTTPYLSHVADAYAPCPCPRSRRPQQPLRAASCCA
jgi:hypothetical protein